MPNTDVIKLWVEALESGDYAQTTGRLQRTGPSDRPAGYCCLGVLCDVAIKQGVPIGRFDLYDSVLFCNLENSEDASWEVLPNVVMEWAGLDTDDPLIDGHTASEWNDVCRTTFPEIADKIRKEFLDD